MEDAALINLWKSYDKKLEEVLTINKKHTEAITQMKIQTFLSSMKPLKIFALVLGILWVGFVDVLIINLFSVASPFFLISAGIQVILTKVAIGIYLYQLVLMQQVDTNQPVVATQHKLAQLKSSTLWVARLLFLQLPVWTTFFWSEGIFESDNLPFLVINGVITLLFTYVAIWLFFNIKFENRDKKWFRLIFNGKEWTPVIKSMELLREIEDYQKESRVVT
jgi:hypothetical protein